MSKEKKDKGRGIWDWTKNLTKQAPLEEYDDLSIMRLVDHVRALMREELSNKDRYRGSVETAVYQIKEEDWDKGPIPELLTPEDESRAAALKLGVVMDHGNRFYVVYGDKSQLCLIFPSVEEDIRVGLASAGRSAEKVLDGRENFVPKMNMPFYENYKKVDSQEAVEMINWIGRIAGRVR